MPRILRFFNFSIEGLDGDGRDGFLFRFSFDIFDEGKREIEVFINGTNAEILSGKLLDIGVIDAQKDAKKWKSFMGSIAGEVLFEIGKMSNNEALALEEHEAVGKITDPNCVSYVYHGQEIDLRKPDMIEVALDDGSKLTIEI